MGKSRVSWLTVVLLILSGGMAFANGLNLNGTGAKAIAMGGAFIGLADDGSAVFWNPGGLTQIRKVTLFGFETDLIPKGTYRYDPAKIDTHTEFKVYPSGAFAVLAPVGEKLVLGASFYVPAGTGGKWNGEDLKALSRGVAYQWESLNTIITFAPAAAVKLSDQVSFGATLNFNRADLDLKRPGLGQYDEEIGGWSLGATFGLHVRASKRVSLGATVRTPSTLKLDGSATMSGASALRLSTSSTVKREQTWPLWIGGGLAVKASDKLTLTGDVQWTNWKKVQVIGITYGEATWEAAKKSALTAPAFDNSFNLQWHDAAQVRVGAEYALSKAWALRGGYYYDPSPSPAFSLNILLPEATYNVGTLGVGYKKGKVAVDLCVEALLGGKRDAVLEGTQAPKMPGTHGMNILVPNLSLSYAF